MCYVLCCYAPSQARWFWLICFKSRRVITGRGKCVWHLTRGQVAKCKVSCSRLSLAPPNAAKPHWVNTAGGMHPRLFHNQPIFQLCIFREGLSSNYYKKKKEKRLTVSECCGRTDCRFCPKIWDPHSRSWTPKISSRSRVLTVGRGRKN